MRYALSLFLLLAIMISCNKNNVDSSTTSCAYPGVKLTRTHEFIKDVSATIIAYPSSSQPVTYHIMRGGTSAPLGSCNLPSAFAKDSLKVFVSGYFLTFPGLDFINLTPLPFEVTAIKLRE